jgi:hemerythrin
MFASHSTKVETSLKERQLEMLECLGWTPDLATGSEEIDAQHKILLQKFSNLIRACAADKGRVEVSRFLDFLRSYVVFHFAAEENYMIEFKYAQYAEHKQRHEEFKLTIADIYNKVEFDGPTLSATLHTTRVALEWIRNHIRVFDKELGQFANNCLSHGDFEL